MVRLAVGTIVALLLLSGCGGESDSAAQPKASEKSSTPKVAYFVKDDTDAINLATATAIEAGSTAVDKKNIAACNQASSKGYPAWRACWHALLDPLKSYATATATRNAYEFEIDAAPGCHGANACFVATFSGTRGGKLPFKANARLATGDPAAFHGFSCGGSCSPDSFYFTHKGVLYEYQVKDFPQRAPKATFVGMANQAIAAGPR